MAWKRVPRCLTCLILLVPATKPAAAQEEPLPQGWEYAQAMRAVSRKAAAARPGVVLHVGDSITYASPYAGWARAGRGRTAADVAALKWMHAGARDDTDGWHLATFDHPDGGRSHTACGGIRADEMLAGGKQRMPPLADLLDRYKPQAVVLMLGTNDASAGRAVEAYRKDIAAAVDLMLSRGVVPVLSTIPPHVHRRELAASYNDSLRALAKDRRLPLIDFEREILTRRPDDWDGTLLNKGDVHPTAARAGVDQTSAPTAANLRESGYLLRGWLSVRKIAEVKRAVFDDPAPPAPGAAPGNAPRPPATGPATRPALGNLDITTLPESRRTDARRMLARDADGRLRDAGHRETAAWQALGSRADWQKYAAARVERMRSALNVPADVRAAPVVTVTHTAAGDGWVADAIAFESRPGLAVTANLYRPAEPVASMPGILLSHSHHAPRTEGELRDMGVGWARAGCVVLVPDHLGHGERRAHPFTGADSYPKQFRAGRQDYYFRYNTSLQLYAAGETLMGWMAYDLIRGVDVLLAHRGVDPRRIALLGAVAGGGDPAAVAAALDPRITAVAPFNFGGPQPETRFPLPQDAESSFDYTGGGSWESTRNLYRSAADGFLPWVIVGSVAPRTLVYGHEFAWDQPRDPVWRRLGTIWDWHAAAGKLGSARGRGAVTGRAPESTHCNNIGPEHRRQVAAWLKRAADISEPLEGGDRPAADDLLVKPAAAGLKPAPLHEVIARLADDRRAAAAERLAKLPPDQRRAAARDAWSKVLGDVEPPHGRESRDEIVGPAAGQHPWVAHRVLHPERDVVVPVTLLSSGGWDRRRPAVVMFAQQGKQKLLAARADDVRRLLDAGLVVCLADLRGFGETAAGSGRGRGSEATSVSASHLMLGDPLVAGQLRDLRCVLRHLRASAFVDPARVALWGDSLAAANPPDVVAAVPLDLDQPAGAEPAAALLALLGGLFEDVAAVHARGGLAEYRDLLRSPFVHVPHDAVVPGVIGTGDVPALTAALSPTAVLTSATVDAWNRPAGRDDRAAAEGPATWVVEQLRGP